ncbi:MAG: glucose-6-phosphate dehydrogenase, partial [Planctomycetales bacterium 12-60-4]
MATSLESLVVPIIKDSANNSRPEPVGATIVIFGASGDLTARKLMPALYDLWHHGYLHDDSPIVGVARRSKTDESFRAEIYEAVQGHVRAGSISPNDWSRFSKRLFYRELDIATAAGYAEFRQQLEDLEQHAPHRGKRVFYMATSPELFRPAVEAIANAGLVPPSDSHDWLRVVFEKPFGHDYDSARELNTHLQKFLREHQIFRIDHYLGKDTVQNILLFRFGNSIFDPLLNRNHVDHVQITVAESQGMERERGALYDTSGALRDVIQNHVLQLLGLIAMEPPSKFSAAALHSEKLKVLKTLAPGHRSDISRWVVSGQYGPGEVGDESAVAYREEKRVPPGSRTETYTAMKVYVDNWRWAGVPFYLRTGKRLPTRVTEISIQFKLPPLNLFSTVECEGDICDLVGARPNTLVFRFQPSESISLSFSTKRPGMQYQIHPVTMDFRYDGRFPHKLPEAYERLLLDVL